MSKVETQTLIDTTKKLKQLFLDKDWTQRTFARSVMGAPVDWWSEAACSFCLSGGIRRVAVLDVPISESRYQVVDALSKQIEDHIFSTIPTWNDEPCRTKKDVLNLLDKVVVQLGGTPE